MPSLVWADGGTIRLSEQRGEYRITVFTTPALVRAGPVDISVLVQDAATGELAPAVQATISAKCLGAHGTTLRQVATTEAATNKLYRAAIFDLPEAGLWEVNVAITGDLGKAEVSFGLDAAPPLPRWLVMWPWFTWPALVILLFGIHLLLARSKSRGPSRPRTWVVEASLWSVDTRRSRP
jgi:hypothetical protein